MATKDQNKSSKSKENPANAVEIDDDTVAERSLDLGFIGSREEAAASRTVASRNRLRKKVDSEVEAFLASGGKINYIDPNVTSDAPKRPVSQYGQRPI